MGVSAVGAPYDIGQADADTSRRSAREALLGDSPAANALLAFDGDAAIAFAAYSFCGRLSG
jgi:hypothetical protein